MEKCNSIEDQIDRFKKCMAGIWAVEDKHDWPVRLNQILPLFAKEFTLDLLQCIEQLRRQGLTEAEIGYLFGQPARIFRNFDLILKGMYQLGLSSKEKKEKVVELLRYVQTLKAGSVFNEDGKNIIWTDEVVNHMESVRYIEDDLEKYRKIQLVIGLTKAYIEQLYFRCYDISQEIHGPYLLQNNSWLLIREFSQLVPAMLWPDFKFVPLPQIRIYTLYNDSLHISLDSYNHLYCDRGSFRDALLCANIEGAAGKQDMNGLLQDLSGCIKHNTRSIGEMNWKEAAIKYVDIFYYKIAPLFEKACYAPQYLNRAKENVEKGNITVNTEEFFQRDKVQLLLSILL